MSLKSILQKKKARKIADRVLFKVNNEPNKGIVFLFEKGYMTRGLLSKIANLLPEDWITMPAFFMEEGQEIGDENEEALYCIIGINAQAAWYAWMDLIKGIKEKGLQKEYSYLLDNSAIYKAELEKDFGIKLTD